jgi:hypothetical protein
MMAPVLMSSHEHAATLWQRDFMVIKSLTPKGFRDLFVLVFVHVETRGPM